MVNVCNHAGEACSFFSGKNIIHGSFEDPAEFKRTDEESMEKIRQVRDEIKIKS